MAAIVDVTSENISGLVAHPLLIVIWCVQRSAPWHAFSRIYGRIAARHPQIIFGVIDVEHEAALATACGIADVPMIMAFGRGRLQFARAGFEVEDSLEAIAHALRQLAARLAVTPVA
jgi:thioredoxin 1